MKPCEKCVLPAVQTSSFPSFRACARTAPSPQPSPPGGRGRSAGAFWCTTPIWVALLAACAFGADSQKEAEPRVIDPGPPPSDAIVLFDGKDLSQWKNEKGEEAKWKGEDGFVTVNGTGRIMTKEE